VRVVISGSSGLIGGALGASLAGTGDEMIRLVRRAPASAAEIQWDPHARAARWTLRPSRGLMPW
jgi:hypothetical protein